MQAARPAGESCRPTPDGMIVTNDEVGTYVTFTTSQGIRQELCVADNGSKSSETKDVKDVEVW